jgi:hypothetical protein
MRMLPSLSFDSRGNVGRIASMKRPKFPRWLTPRFSLRTLFVLVTAAGFLAMGGVWQLRKIDQRRDYLKQQLGSAKTPGPGEARPWAPWVLWMWGESGEIEIFVQSPGFATKERRDYHRKHPCAEAIEARELFPEAIICVLEDAIVWTTWFPGKDWEWY